MSHFFFLTRIQSLLVLLVALDRYVVPTALENDQRLTALQPLSLLLKICPLVDELSLYDVVNTPGVATDLSHLSTPAVRVAPTT
jgi:lactate/malate dehydrogenase, NAD binding domain